MVNVTPFQDAPVSAVIPARNEAPTIGRVVDMLSAMDHVAEILVVDNGSDDDTAALAARAGARVIHEARPGMGHAIRAGFSAARHDWVMKADADLDRFDMGLFPRMITARAPGVGLIKGAWQDPADPMPMTRYLVGPALRQMFPGLGGLRAPNSGLYVFDRSLIALHEIVGDYAADLDVMLRVHAAGAEISEVEIGQINNNPRDASHYTAMTDTIMAFFLRQRDLRILHEITVLAETAGQVIAGCLGVIAGHARAGGRVSVFLDTGIDNAEAQVLRDALQAFPTVRIGPLAGACVFQPGAHAAGLRIIAPDGARADARALNAALGSLCGSAPEGEKSLWLMPDDRSEANAFYADTSLPAGAGAAIKEAALARIGMGLDRRAREEIFRRSPLPL